MTAMPDTLASLNQPAQSLVNATTFPDETPNARAQHPYQLGASLYMPATRQDIWQVIKRDKLPTINSIIICLEDAVSQNDVDLALNQFQSLLKTWQSNYQSINSPNQTIDSDRKNPIRPLVFVRPRNPEMLYQLADFEHINLIDGFVLPKVDLFTLPKWVEACAVHDANKLLMPTLETAAVFNPQHNEELAAAFKDAFNQSIFALRIGGNDLFAALRLRRPKDSIVYETPIGMLAYQLLGAFVPHGFYLSAPVFEYLDQPMLFMQELNRDVSLGLVGKTVIHPSQIALVQQAFCVPSSILEEAQQILHAEAKAVFKFNNTMLEPATHRAWATEIINRAAVFGTINDSPSDYKPLI